MEGGNSTMREGKEGIDPRDRQENRPFLSDVAFTAGGILESGMVGQQDPYLPALACLDVAPARPGRPRCRVSHIRFQVCNCCIGYLISWSRPDAVRVVTSPGKYTPSISEPDTNHRARTWRDAALTPRS